ncbi:MAG: TonB-dependent receptor plug domain-containing protein [Actinomycetota bacterium]
MHTNHPVFGTLGLPLSRKPLVGALFMAWAAAYAQETTLKEVSVVAASDVQEQRRNAPTAKIVFGREELDRMDANSIGELLRKLPGTGISGDLDGKRGRGRAPDRFMPQILVDGQPLPGGQRNPATALRLPADLIERIEVIRNGSAEFPGAGPGGTINLVLRDVPPKATRGARVGIGESDGRAAFRGDGQWGENQGDFGYLLAGSVDSRPTTSRRDTGIERFAGGARNAWSLEHAEEQGRDANVSLAPRFNWKLGDNQQFTLTPFLNHTETDRDGLIRRSAYADPVAGTGLAAAGRDQERDEARRTSGRLAAEWSSTQPGGTELSARLMLQGETESQRKAVRRFDAAGASTGTSDEATERRERETALILKGKKLFGDAHVVTGGAEVRAAGSDEKKDARSNGVTQILGPDGRASLEENRDVLWVQDEWQLADQHLVTPGLRWQQQRARIVDGAGTVITHDYQSVDPSLHYLWQPDAAWNLRSSIAQSGKPPRTRDLSPVVRTATGSNTSSNPDRGGNAQLKAERNLSLEAGVEHFLPKRLGTVGFSLFRRWIDDQVQRLTQLEGGRWVERPYNVGDAVLNGGVADFKLKGDAFGVAALSDLTLRGNYAVTHTRLVNPVPGLGAGEGPRRSWNLGFDYDFPAWRLTLGGDYGYTSALDRESSATLRQTQGARRQIDIYALQKIDRQLSLRLSVKNVTRATRGYDLRETDGAGNLLRQEHDLEKTVPTVLLTLEGKW